MGQERQLPRIGINVAAGTLTALSGTLTISSANGISWGMDSAYNVTAALPSAGIASISAGTTLASSGQVVFSNSNGISFGASGQTLTAQLATLSFWCNNLWDSAENGPQGPFTPYDIYFQYASFPLNINATRAILVASGSAGTTGTINLQVGFYTISGSTASLATLASSTATVEPISDNQGGVSWKSIASTFAITPGPYLIGIACTGQVSSNGNSILDFNLIGGVIRGVSNNVMAIGGDDNGAYFGDGYYRSQFSTGLPSSVHVTDVVKTIPLTASYSFGTPATTFNNGIAGGGQPFLMLIGS